ncbi:uncharacterized protein UHO2_00706 [Ustilago hordei]|uniref:RNA methyltransferase n=1 Tax=Ustilago hordei TaxID=120017 RepID=I2FWI7_USTHO|nr:uncharacterized protein UHO2_00706 [Ustilago hordei]CCF51280.1 uncharacterized protein UHOR_01193 [Ustilago hordei]SYW82221.1 uncharacterized protein UHO2_00706 [Ustilago hordei]
MSMNRRDVANQSVRARMETESKEAWEMEAERDRSQKLGRNPAATLFPGASSPARLGGEKNPSLPPTQARQGTTLFAFHPDAVSRCRVAGRTKLEYGIAEVHAVVLCRSCLCVLAFDGHSHNADAYPSCVRHVDVTKAKKIEAQGQPYRSTCSSLEHDHLASQVMRRIKPKQRARGTNDVIPKSVHGNFQRYYHIRNPTTADDDNDAADGNSASRSTVVWQPSCASLLHTMLIQARLQQVRVLDIGCNSGKLTIQLAQTLLALLRKVSGDGTGVEIIGVDIDPKLIGQAKEAAGIARSLHRPPKLSSEEGVAGGEQLPTETVFFPSCFPALFGPLKSAANDDERGAKGRRASTAHLEPRLLRLIAAEWVHPSPATSSSFHYSLHPLSHLTNLDKRQYSTILVLSITKWIHIQRSDSGLTLFFARLSSTLLPGGLLFLKRQEWKSYSTPRTSTLG